MNNINNNSFSPYDYRFLAKVIIEAETPLAIGSGQSTIMTDSPVIRDVNGLPYIPGSTIAGVIRSMIDQKKSNQIFGFQNQNEGHGSEIIFSEAKMLDSNGNPVDCLQPEAINNDPLLKKFKELPIRQHVHINSSGTAENHNKFDEEIVYKGTRFCFEIEMLAKKEEDLDDFKSFLDKLNDFSFRLGHGSSKGFGAIRVIDLKQIQLNLTEPEQLKSYLNKSSKLNDTFWETVESTSCEKNYSSTQWHHYEIILHPRDFMMFSSGLSDEDSDRLPVKESIVDWSSGNGMLTEQYTLIPASSVKGALAHRTAYHWNKNNEYYIGDTNAKTGEENPAIQLLFGHSGKNENDIKKGNVLFSDIIEKTLCTEKIFNHVSIDRFTGGAIDGALFSNKATFAKGQEFTMNIYVSSIKVPDGCDELKAFEQALNDLAIGLLPLGGGVNNGFGLFTADIKKNNVLIFNEKGDCNNEHK